MSVDPSPIRNARADALAQLVAVRKIAWWRRPLPALPDEVTGELGLTASTYDRLRDLGLTRGDVARAVDDLVAQGRAGLHHEAGIVIVRTPEARP